MQDAKKALKKYKSNESNNLHSDNFVLLAQTFQDEKELGVDDAFLSAKEYLKYKFPNHV